jgi:hypothetical protein
MPALLERFEGMVSNVTFWSGKDAVISESGKRAQHHI